MSHAPERSFLFLERNDPTKSGPRTPDASTQTSELHDLAVINEKVGVRTLVLDVIRKDWVGQERQAKGCADERLRSASKQNKNK